MVIDEDDALLLELLADSMNLIQLLDCLLGLLELLLESAELLDFTRILSLSCFLESLLLLNFGGGSAALRVNLEHVSADSFVDADGRRILESLSYSGVQLDA